MNAKKAKKEITISLAGIIDELNATNGKVFELKQGCKMLIDQVKTGNIAAAQQVIEICNLESIIKSLSPE
jgi:hypothetical protein